MCNEWILTAGVLLSNSSSGKDQAMGSGGVLVAHIVGGQQPSNGPMRIFVDHVNWHTTDDEYSPQLAPGHAPTQIMASSLRVLNFSTRDLMRTN